MLPAEQQATYMQQWEQQQRQWEEWHQWQQYYDQQAGYRQDQQASYGQQQQGYGQEQSAGLDWQQQQALAQQVPPQEAWGQQPPGQFPPGQDGAQVCACATAAIPERSPLSTFCGQVFLEPAVVWQQHLSCLPLCSLSMSPPVLQWGHQQHQYGAPGGQQQQQHQAHPLGSHQQVRACPQAQQVKCWVQLHSPSWLLCSPFHWPSLQRMGLPPVGTGSLSPSLHTAPRPLGTALVSLSPLHDCHQMH